MDAKLASSCTNRRDEAGTARARVWREESAAGCLGAVYIYLTTIPIPEFEGRVTQNIRHPK